MKSVNISKEKGIFAHSENKILTGSVVAEIISENNERVFVLSDFFKHLSDSTRLKILISIFNEPLCVLEISKALGITSSRVSHQLKILKGANLVEAKRVGKKVYYSIVKCHVRDIIEMALAHMEESY